MVFIRLFDAIGTPVAVAGLSQVALDFGFATCSTSGINFYSETSDVTHEIRIITGRDEFDC